MNDANEASNNDDIPMHRRIVQARPKRKTEKTLLPVNYEPSKFTIICGRGKGSYQSDGNVNFRALVKNNLERYKEAPGRLEKSFIVSEVLAMIRESCPVGAFVKYEKGRWYDLDDTVCREKVGSLFRDFLHTEYKSSSKAKHARKVAEKTHGKGSDGESSNKKAPKQPTAAKPKRKPKIEPPAEPQLPMDPPPPPQKAKAKVTLVAPAPTLVRTRLPAQRAKPKQETRTAAPNDSDLPPTFYDIDDLALSKLE